MPTEKYFADKKSNISVLIRVFLALLLVFAIVFFLWSLMKYNKTMEEKAEKQAYIEQLSDDVEQLRYLVDAPLDDAFKIRIAREKLGMCFPDEIIYHTGIQ